MGWSLGYDMHWSRDVGYDVPAMCDHPRCTKEINRGLSYVCGGEPYGGEHGCGLYFCYKHLAYRHPQGHDQSVQNCYRCREYKNPYTPKADILAWVTFKLHDPSWETWRENNPELVAKLRLSIPSV